MSTLTHTRHIITTGLAMFSMFFGAGNIVFPLMVGQHAGSMAWMAIVGLLVGAVGVPFLGLIAMTYFDGDHHPFFERIGSMPGYLVTSFILILIGPVNAIPRCIAMSYGTIKMYAPNLSLFIFSLVACLIIFAATVKKSGIIDLLGDLLSPLLVISLAIIIIKGLWSHPVAPESTASLGSMLRFGIEQGYNTMDLLGTFFFSGVIIAGLRHLFPKEKSTKVLAKYALQASIIGGTLLGAVYIGFALLASYYGATLANTSPEVLLGTVAHIVLGKAGGFFVSMAVALACLTTAITLASIFAEFLQEQSVFKRLSYPNCLAITLFFTFLFSNMGFRGIVSMMVPILQVIYPALIVLTIMNIFYKVRGVQMVKLPVFLVAAISLVIHQAPTALKLVGLTGF